MKFTIERDVFAAMAAACCRVASKSHLTHLATVMVEARGDKAMMTATDVNHSIRAIRSAVVDEQGRSLVPQRWLAGVAPKMRGGAVEVECDGSILTVRCGRQRASVSVVDGSDWPEWQWAEPTASVPAERLAAVVQAAARYAGKDGSRCEGVAISASGGAVTATATDEMAVCEASAPCEGEMPMVMMRPSDLADAAAAMEGDAAIGFDGSLMCVTCGSVHVTAAPLATRPLPYGRVLDSVAWGSAALVGAREVAAAVELCSGASSDRLPVAEFRMEGGTMRISSSSQDGSAESEIDSDGIRDAAFFVNADRMRGALGTAAAFGDVSMVPSDGRTPVGIAADGVRIVLMPMAAGAQ